MDPRQRRRHGIMVFVGYALIGFAILLATVILIYMAYGFGYKNGQVIQNGLVFVSSKPNPAEFYINGVRNKNNTNTRVTLPAGDYTFELKRDGYRSWQRSVTVEGGSVSHYDYPFLFPIDLRTTTLHTYDAAPGFVTQSPDRRWLVAQPVATSAVFDVYDLKDLSKQPTVLTLPDGVVTRAAKTESYQLVEWSNDNVHLLLKHTYDKKFEYIMVNRSKPAESLNVTQALSLAPAAVDVRLIDKKYDRFYVFDVAKQTLVRASLAVPQPVPYLDHVLAYQSYHDDTVLYVASDGDTAAAAVVRLKHNDATYRIREVPLKARYLLDLTEYSGDMYAVVSASSQGRAYIYRNPLAQLTNKDVGVAVPIQVLRVGSPTYVAFSANAQYVLVENGTQFAIYDVENKDAYSYTVPMPLDKPQRHATWMDCNRLLYTSGGKLVVFDYDGRNRQTLVAANPRYLPFFTPDFKRLLMLAPDATQAGHQLLTNTSLLTPEDQ